MALIISAEVFYVEREGLGLLLLLLSSALDVGLSVWAAPRNPLGFSCASLLTIGIGFSGGLILTSLMSGMSLGVGVAEFRVEVFSS
jgi:H+/Cl- antiporter ClcA